MLTPTKTNDLLRSITQYRDERYNETETTAISPSFLLKLSGHSIASRYPLFPKLVSTLLDVAINGIGNTSHQFIQPIGHFLA